MRPTLAGVVGGAFLALTTVSAHADCAAELARLTGDSAATEGAAAGEGIAKDGTLAPLEGAEGDAAAGAAIDTAATGTAETPSGGDSAAAETDAGADAMAEDHAMAEGGDMAAGAADAEGVAKDGSLAPLEETEGEAADTAMSGADAQAQQEGQPTAAAQAEAGAAPADAAGNAMTRDDHIQAARDALAAGDEDACMKAVEAAAAM